MFGKGRLYFPSMWRKAVSLRLCTAECYMPNVIYTPGYARGLKFFHGKDVNFQNFSNKRCTLQTCNIRYHQTFTSVSEFRLSSQNLYASNILATCERYSNTLSSPTLASDSISIAEVESLIDMNWKSASMTELLDGFKSLSYHVKDKSKDEYDNRYNNLFDAMIENLRTFNYNELCEIFKYLQLWNQSTLDDNHYFYAALDKECIKRLKKLSIDQVLLMLDLWYKLARIKNGTMLKGLSIIGSKPNRMSPSNLVQFMFYVNVCRKPLVNMYEIEYRFENCLNDLTIDEMGIVALGFFKTKTRIVNPDLVARLIQTVINNVAVIHEITLGCFLKIIRYSLHLPETTTFHVLLKHLVKQVPRLSVQCLTQVVHSAASAHIFEKDLLDAVIEKFVKEVDMCRLKDIERLSYTISTFNYDKCNPIYDIIIQELRSPKRLKEIEVYPKVVAYTLMHMACADVYPKDLLNMVMTSSFIQNMYGKSMMKSGRDMLFLAYSIEIEVPDYTGAKINSQTLNYLVKTHGCLQPIVKRKVSPMDKLLNEVAHTCKEVLNCNEAIYINTVLPHFLNSDIVVCLNEHNCGVPIDSIFADMPPSSIKRPPEMSIKNLKWFVLMMTSRSNFISNCSMYTGIVTARERQLRRIGYTPIKIQHCDWFKLISAKHRQNYIKNLLFK